MKKILCLFFSIIIFCGCNVAGNVCANSTGFEVSAKACVLIEAQTGRVLFAKNSDEKLSMASTTKIMTTLLCLESGNLDEEFVVDKNAIKVEGSSMGLVEGDVVTKRMLCYGMLLPSGNDAANATAIKLAGSFENFAKMMNERAEKIGMTRTCFVTPSGLEGAGHASTAYDMSLLAREALKNPDFREICSQKTAKVKFGNPPYERWLTNTNKLLSNYAGTIGVKTGFTDEAGRCLVSACEREGITLICVTLNDCDDWADHAKLYDYGFSATKLTQLAQKPESLNINVVGAEKNSIKIGIKDGLSVATLDGDLSKVTTKVITPPFIYAPVANGEEVGSLEYYWEDKLIDTVPLYALEDATQKVTEKKENTFEKLKDKVTNIFKKS